MYIFKDISYVLQRDLQIYSPKELEPIFIEITILNKPSSLLGTIYKHPSTKPYTLNNKFLEPLLSKIKAEDKITILVRDFNFNLIKYRQNKGSAEFLDHLFSNNFTPQKNYSKNFFINKKAFCSVSGNLTTSISDHLP